MATIYWRGCAGRRRLGWLLAAAGCLLMADLPAIAADTLPSETPSEFVPRVDTFDYSKREVMIPMRDGVKLKNLILIPRGAHPAPILLTRTPYGATELITNNRSAPLSPPIHA